MQIELQDVTKWAEDEVLRREVIQDMLQDPQIREKVAESIAQQIVKAWTADERFKNQWIAAAGQDENLKKMALAQSAKTIIQPPEELRESHESVE